MGEERKSWHREDWEEFWRKYNRIIIPAVAFFIGYGLAFLRH